MATKINLNSIDCRQKAEEYLSHVQIGCRERTFDYEGIVHACGIGEKMMEDAQIPKNHRKGARMTFGFEKFPNCYKYAPIGTIFTVERGTKEWFLVNAERVNCNGSRRFYMAYNNLQKKIIAEKAIERYSHP